MPVIESNVSMALQQQVDIFWVLKAFKLTFEAVSGRKATRQYGSAVNLDIDLYNSGYVNTIVACVCYLSIKSRLEAH